MRRLAVGAHGGADGRLVLMSPAWPRGVEPIARPQHWCKLAHNDVRTSHNRTPQVDGFFTVGNLASQMPHGDRLRSIDLPCPRRHAARGAERDGESKNIAVRYPPKRKRTSSIGSADARAKCAEKQPRGVRRLEDEDRAPLIAPSSLDQLSRRRTVRERRATEQRTSAMARRRPNKDTAALSQDDDPAESVTFAR